MKDSENIKVKAYIVSDKWNDAGSIVIWAETSGKAKAQALYNDIFDNSEFTELRTQRVKDFDKYAESKKVPIQKLLNMYWWFSCCECLKDHLDKDSIDNEEAFIIDSDERDDFVLGTIICAECKKKFEEQKPGETE